MLLNVAVFPWKCCNMEGMKEMDALRAITLDAAKICRVDHRLGSLTVGKDADIVVTDENFEVKKTIIAGEINILLLLFF